MAVADADFQIGRWQEENVPAAESRTTMKAKRTMWQRQTVVAEDPKVKTLDFVLEGNEHGLKEASIRLFDMAKSAGRELNVLFCGEHN